MHPLPKRYVPPKGPEFAAWLRMQMDVRECSVYRISMFYGSSRQWFRQVLAGERSPNPLTRYKIARALEEIDAAYPELAPR